jgi:hypothetical protein
MSDGNENEGIALKSSHMPRKLQADYAPSQ